MLVLAQAASTSQASLNAVLQFLEQEVRDPAAYSVVLGLLPPIFVRLSTKTSALPWERSLFAVIGAGIASLLAWLTSPGITGHPLNLTALLVVAGGSLFFAFVHRSVWLSSFEPFFDKLWLQIFHVDLGFGSTPESIAVKAQAHIAAAQAVSPAHVSLLAAGTSMSAAPATAQEIQAAGAQHLASQPAAAQPAEVVNTGNAGASPAPPAQ